MLHRTSATSVGDFTTVLTTINPTLILGVYPTAWTQFSGTFGAMAAASGRLAFRYFVTNGGPDGANSDIISIDAVRLADDTPQAPDTAMSNPGAIVATDSVTLTLSEPTREPVTGFECNLDATGFTSCPASATFNGLDEGSHTIAARAVAGALVDPTPASVGFFVDTIDPATSLTPPTTPRASTTVDLSFSADDTGGSGIDLVQCRRDSTTPGAWTPCATTTSHSYTNLAEAMHTFDVRGVDDATPATATVVIDLTGPTVSITEQPPASTTSTSAVLAFNSADAAGFACRLDAAAFAACTSPVSLTSLALGGAQLLGPRHRRARQRRRAGRGGADDRGTAAAAPTATSARRVARTAAGRASAAGGTVLRRSRRSWPGPASASSTARRRQRPAARRRRRRRARRR